jgi:hypothetical protein
MTSVYYYVLQEGTQEPVLDPQAHHEELQDVRSSVHHHQQVHPSQGGDPQHQGTEEGEGLEPRGPA